MKTKNGTKSKLIKSVVLGGLMAGSAPLVASETDLYNYGDLGTGAELRTNLLDKYGSPLNATKPLGTDFVLGEAKCGEGKCGEGKCGEEKKAEKKKEAKSSEAKTTEAKSGGEKPEKKEEKKPEKKEEGN